MSFPVNIEGVLIQNFPDEWAALVPILKQLNSTPSDLATLVADAMAGVALASQVEAEAGTENTKMMTSLRVAQAIAALETAHTLASQVEAEAGTENTKIMTALRVAQAIAALQRDIASQVEAEAGALNTKDMTPLRVAQAIAALAPAGSVATVSVSSADLLGLFAAPKELVAAPAAGSFHVLIAPPVIIYNAGGTAYTIGTAGNLTLNYRPDGSGDALTVGLASTGFLDSATDLVRQVAQVSTNVEPVIGANGSIVLKVATASPTVGDGVLTVVVFYRTIASGL